MAQTIFRLKKDRVTKGGYNRHVQTEDMQKQGTANDVDIKETNGSIYSKIHTGDGVYVIVVDTLEEVYILAPNWVDPTIKKVKPKSKSKAKREKANSN